MCVTSYTVSCLIQNERADSLRDALVATCVQLRPLDGPPAVIRTDPAPGFVSLVHDAILKQHRICLEVGRVKNRNKNPVAEKAIQELEDELLRLHSHEPGAYVSPRMLAVATANLNARIRSRGLSAREMWSQRDQFTNQQIPVSDQELIMKQHNQRTSNHHHSALSKTPKGRQPPESQVHVGDLVYLFSDRDKTKARQRYLVVSIDGNWCNINKFTGNQLRSTSYRVKHSECYTVPSDVSKRMPSHEMGNLEVGSDEEDDYDLSQSVPADSPHIPSEISKPVNNRPPPVPEPYILASELEPDEPDVSFDGEDPVQGTVNDNPRRSARPKRSPVWLEDFVT